MVYQISSLPILSQALWAHKFFFMGGVHVLLHVAFLGEAFGASTEETHVWLFLVVGSDVVKEVVPLVEELFAVLFFAFEELGPLFGARIEVLNEGIVLGVRYVKLYSMVTGVYIYSFLNSDDGLLIEKQFRSNLLHYQGVNIFFIHTTYFLFYLATFLPLQAQTHNELIFFLLCFFFFWFGLMLGMISFVIS